MALKIALNGFGRIGRCVTRLAAMRNDVELVAINDMASIDMLLYLLQNDSVHGSFTADAAIVDKKYLQIGKNRVRILCEKDPEKLDFAFLGADVVFECSGLFLSGAVTKHHLEKGVKKVILSAPTQDDAIPTFVLGVNEHLYAGQDILSNASCTTNCLGPIARILDETFGIEKGLMTTIHAYTNGQAIIDSAHGTDMRRSRAAALNMIPTTTGAAKAISLVLPNLEGKLHGQSVRVPTPDVSMVDLNVVVGRSTSKEELSDLFKSYANGVMKGILEVDERYRVSQDFVGSPFSATVADDLIQVIDGNMIKVMAWYDNEWGYSNRLIEMALYVSAYTPKV
ncbi:MAG: type I glyceraldehyde-3-phosphate dehydrogenase [Sulfuricurvum sp. GWF2_44_89]|uniref:type I glyceraldehyde-3-phosphate dehydrogenase n=1 Tax=unclassified Sulfuricurvum TaxID=2632390 RepID=UPI0008BE93CD|nr:MULTISPECIES: type I glyceraldehyde-3-phosphate dehydrogenase [unclassified Sulfuricurvum]OHD78167.1 MAG: type I glyceraldehyde-3-phosphate dehydrogenase [Sulfuricurvum sp. GWF2_44_89]OHD91412.1 MAG: type I glyceraldehyde-3-phosphate dehydrogenase [Sulfuricurvum sp. RIFOXYD12_FULL_44_77]OHD91825.1 MAG: type I glyceraldehyde-3-phosphate dehydrogenase [Sulfuricurvum sp. RIFOXYD2_FULL_44_160]